MRMSGNTNFGECACFNARRAARILGQAHKSPEWRASAERQELFLLAGAAGKV